MMSSLEKLRKLALFKSDAKDKKDHQSLAHLDELAQAFQDEVSGKVIARGSKDMQDMRSCYDNLLSAAAATANSAYEFSESLLEMGTCLLERTGLGADGESGNAFLMLGRVQLELQKLIDRYRSHIILTVTNPSESLLSELQKVEGMKLQCDEKREVYEHMLAQYREKGKFRSGRGENITSQQVKVAHEEYDDAARLCVFRVKSLKQGQFNSLLTQAARHHTAQLNFFRDGLKSLEAVDPQIKLVSEKQHIDYKHVGLDDGEDGESGSVKSYENIGDGELSFDYRPTKEELDNDCKSRISMEINLTKNQGEQIFGQLSRPSSHSAPIYPDKVDPAERARQIQSSVRKFHTYVLPTPVAAKISASRTTQSTSAGLSTNTMNQRYSSPLDTEKRQNSNNSSIRLPPPLSDGRLLPQFDRHNSIDVNKNTREAFSGPIPSKPWSTKALLSMSSPITSPELPQPVSGLFSRVPISQPSTSPNVSRSVSPPLASSPKISELHELPRPPGSLVSKPISSSMIGHSAPLVIRNHELSPTNRSPRLASNAASLLPAPPLTVPRSFSIPSGSQRAMALHVAKQLESSKSSEKVEEVTSPLTLISLSNMVSSPSNSGQNRGGS